jgi:hypothetical protein
MHLGYRILIPATHSFHAIIFTMKIIPTIFFLKNSPTLPLCTYSNQYELLKYSSISFSVYFSDKHNARK